MFPIAIAVKTTPIVAIAPLLVIWLGTGWWSKIVAAILICFFPVLVNTVKGLKAADLEYRELFETLGASRAQEFRKLRIPYCLPYLFSALKISSSLAVIGAIVGEFVGATQGPRLSHHHFLGASGNGDAVFGDHRRGFRRHRDVLRHRFCRAAVDLLVERGGGMSMRPISVDVIRIATKGPGDVPGLMAAHRAGKIVASSILAVLGKTEGNGGVNDFTREYALAALCEALSPHLTARAARGRGQDCLRHVGRHRRACSAPHLTVFTRSVNDAAACRAAAASGKRLSIGIAHTRDFLPEEIGRKAQIEETVKAVHLAMRDAGIDDPRDVHFVQIKCPLLTSERIEAALHRGRKTVTTSGYASMGYSRGASALGVAMALGELRARRRRRSGVEGLGSCFRRSPRPRPASS